MWLVRFSYSSANMFLNSNTMRAISKLEECSRIATANITSLDDPSIGNRLNNRESSLLVVQPTVPMTGFTRGFDMNLKPVPRLDSKEVSPESQGEKMIQDCDVSGIVL